MKPFVFTCSARLRADPSATPRPRTITRLACNIRSAYGYLCRDWACITNLRGYHP